MLFLGYFVVCCLTCFIGAVFVVPLSAIDAFKVATKIRSGEQVGKWDAYFFNTPIDLSKYLPSAVTGQPDDLSDENKKGMPVPKKDDQS